jgi:hypothetical protein
VEKTVSWRKEDENIFPGVPRRREAEEKRVQFASGGGNCACGSEVALRAILFPAFRFAFLINSLKVGNDRLTLALP